MFTSTSLTHIVEFMMFYVNCGTQLEYKTTKPNIRFQSTSNACWNRIQWEIIKKKRKIDGWQTIRDRIIVFVCVCLMFKNALEFHFMKHIKIQV